MSEFQNIDMKFSYPRNPNYDYEVRLERINLDEERESDLLCDNGFIISEPQNIKKDLKSSDSIFSERFGQTLLDVNPLGDRYKCSCGYLTSKIYDRVKCPVCGTEVRFVDDNFSLFGWLILKNHYIIHPNLYNSLSYFIGAERLKNMISRSESIDEDGHIIENVIDKSKEEPFAGIGMIDFKEHIQEILDFYLTKSPNKKEYYDDIMSNMDKLFTQSIPVYTTHLRPFKVDGENFNFEGTNSIYNMMARLVYTINKDRLKIQNKKKPKNDLLYSLQEKYNALYDEIRNILGGKRGSLRSCLAGRYNMSARSVIIPNPDMKIDQVTLSYHCLVELLQQSIINILKKSYNMSYADAYSMWYMSQVKENDRIKSIIMSIIKSYKYGLPIIINRNPSLSYGAILQVHCVGIESNYTMGISNNILRLLAGDYDGDTLNIHYIVNQQFYEAAFKVFNPRNAMYISRNDGYFNDLVNHEKDIMININTMVSMGRKHYSKEQLEKIRSVKNL